MICLTIQVLPLLVIVKVSPGWKVLRKVVLVPVTLAELEELVTVPGTRLLWLAWKSELGVEVLMPARWLVVSTSKTDVAEAF